jgi:hypothetical protein
LSVTTLSRKRGPSPTTWGCSGCPTRWTSLTEAHCPVCHCHFRTMDAADRHRRDNTCTDPSTATSAAGTPLFVPSTRGTTVDKAPVWSLHKPTGSTGFAL